jgi:hypothetical protein
MAETEIAYEVIVAMIQVREEAAMDSPKLCTKTKGEVFVVIGNQAVPGDNGDVRLRLKEGGWTSLTLSTDRSITLVKEITERVEIQDIIHEAIDARGKDLTTLPLGSDSAPCDCFPEANSLLLECRSNQQAVELLLGSLWLVEHNLWFTAAAADGATFRRLVLDDYKQQPEFTTAGEPSSLFSSHDVLELPDNPPRKEGPRTTTVHRFVVRKHVEDDLHLSSLRESANAKASALMKKGSGQKEGVRVSNIGGYHSTEEMLNAGVSAWCPLMMSVLSESLVTMTKSAEPTHWLLSGWMNASDKSDYNALHSHGAAEWSFVYFVLPGDSDPDADTRDCSSMLANDSGCLLLRTQLAPFTQQYGFLSIGAAPGELWAFPGHLFHAVMPRKVFPGRTENELASSPPLPPPPARRAEVGERITIACNAVISDYGASKGRTAAEVKILRALAEVKQQLNRSST